MDMSRTNLLPFSANAGTGVAPPEHTCGGHRGRESLQRDKLTVRLRADYSGGSYRGETTDRCKESFHQERDGNTDTSSTVGYCGPFKMSSSIV
jgi:hypothetical protein